MRNPIFKDFFKTDGAGVPKARFNIRVAQGQRASVLNPDHCALIYPHLLEIDKDLDRLRNAIGQTSKTTDSNLVKKIERLAMHGDKLISQAFYLDTKDRNSWFAIEQIFRKRSPGTEFFDCTPKLLELAKHCDNFKAYAEDFALKHQKEQVDHASMPSP